MSTDDDKKKTAGERLDDLADMADDDADRREVLEKTDEELDRDLAAAGVDVERVKARAAKLQAAVAAAAAKVEKPAEAVVVRAEQRFRRRSVAVFMIAAALVALAAATVATTVALREDESDTRVGSPLDAGDAGGD